MNQLFFGDNLDILRNEILDESVDLRERAEIGLFVTLEEPTQAMQKEAVAVGFYEVDYQRRVPRIQVLTIAERLSGRKPEYPVLAVADTFKKPPRAQKGKQPEQRELFGRRA